MNKQVYDIPETAVSRYSGYLSIEPHLVRCESGLHDAILMLNALSGDAMTLFAVDAAGKMRGTVTDGDVRRALLAGHDLNARIEDVMRGEFMAVRPGNPPGPVVSAARKKGIDLIPQLDADGFITKIYDLRIIRSVLPIDAVLMAGGKGERLRPLTLDTPKPLLKVGGKAIIDYNIERLKECGIENIFVTVNYLHEQIEEHFFADRNVTCILEPCRLGTLGSLSLIEDLSHDNILLMNSDLLTNIDFEAMYMHHLSADAEMTVATIPYTVSVPFAILETDGDRVNALVEKPTYNYLANAGVYILNRSLVDRIPKGEYLDTPDFMESIIRDGGKVTHFPVNGTWIDIGSPDDFRFANEVVRNKGLGGE